jgi:hypothetical protein
VPIAVACVGDIPIAVQGHQRSGPITGNTWLHAHGNASAELVRSSRQVRRARASEMIGVIARFGWDGGLFWLVRFTAGPKPRTHTARCRCRATAAPAAMRQACWVQLPARRRTLPVSLRWHETSALMHRGVRATLVREWRIASELSAGFPRQDQRWASSRVPSRLWRHSTQWRSTHRYCARARSAATPIENCRHQAAYLRDGGVPSGADVVPRSFRWARYQRA